MTGKGGLFASQLVDRDMMILADHALFALEGDMRCMKSRQAMRLAAFLDTISTSLNGGVINRIVSKDEY
jgi:hypothetical protein